MNLRCVGAAAILVCLSAALPVSAGEMPCSIRPKKDASKAELQSMARVAQDEAKKAALAALDSGSRAKVREAELEVEHGCLVYSFDIAIPGQKEIQEVLIDAGSGKVLASSKETAKREAAEKTKDRQKP